MAEKGERAARGGDRKSNFPDGSLKLIENHFQNGGGFMQRKKINDNRLIEMLKTGKTQKQAADFFKVSPVAICKRVKRLLPPPKSLENLTEKEKRFAIEVSKGRTATQAALNSYEVGSMESAKVMGSQLMNKPEIKMAINELLDYHGLTRSYRIKKLKEHVDNNDPVVSLKALDMGFKLDGSYKPEENNPELTLIQTLNFIDRFDKEMLEKKKDD